MSDLVGIITELTRCIRQVPHEHAIRPRLDALVGRLLREQSSSNAALRDETRERTITSMVLSLNQVLTRDEARHGWFMGDRDLVMLDRGKHGALLDALAGCRDIIRNKGTAPP